MLFNESTIYILNVVRALRSDPSWIDNWPWCLCSRAQTKPRFPLLFPDTCPSHCTCLTRGQSDNGRRQQTKPSQTPKGNRTQPQRCETGEGTSYHFTSDEVLGVQHLLFLTFCRHRAADRPVETRGAKWQSQRRKGFDGSIWNRGRRWISAQGSKMLWNDRRIYDFKLPELQMGKLLLSAERYKYSVLSV